MVAVNIRNLFSALVLSTLLIQCFGAAEVNTNLTEHDAMDKNVSSSVKPASVLPSSAHATAAGVNANATKPSSDAVPRVSAAEHGAVNKNVSSAKPAIVAHPGAKAKLSNDVPSSRASDGGGFGQSDDEYDDYFGHHDTIGTRTGDPGLPSFEPDVSSTTSAPANSTTQVSSTASAPANTTSQEVPSTTASAPASTTTQEVTSSSTASISHSPKFASTPKATTDGNSTEDDVSSTASQITDGNGAASLTTISSLILAACVSLLFI